MAFGLGLRMRARPVAARRPAARQRRRLRVPRRPKGRPWVPLRASMRSTREAWHATMAVALGHRPWQGHGRYQWVQDGGAT